MGGSRRDKTRQDKSQDKRSCAGQNCSVDWNGNQEGKAMETLCRAAFVCVYNCVMKSMRKKVQRITANWRSSLVKHKRLIGCAQKGFLKGNALYAVVELF